jgi:hypothetical protein
MTAARWLAGAAAATMILGLAGCVTPEELRKEDEAACASFGFKAGTDAFASCLQRESLARREMFGPPPYYPYWGWGWGPGWYPPPIYAPY